MRLSCFVSCSCRSGRSRIPVFNPFNHLLRMVSSCLMMLCLCQTNVIMKYVGWMEEPKERPMVVTCWSCHDESVSSRDRFSRLESASCLPAVIFFLLQIHEIHWDHGEDDAILPENDVSHHYDHRLRESLYNFPSHLLASSFLTSSQAAKSWFIHFSSSASSILMEGRSLSSCVICCSHSSSSPSFYMLMNAVGDGDDHFSHLLDCFTRGSCRHHILHNG